MLKKLYLYLPLLLFPLSLFSQKMTHLETKDLSTILAIEHQMFFINTDTTLSEERVEYFDGAGNLVYLFEQDFDMDRTKHWLKNENLPFASYNIFTDRKKDAYFSEKSLNDSTYQLEHYIEDSLHVFTQIYLDDQTILMLPDSTKVEIEFDTQHNFVEQKYLKKDGTLQVRFEYETLSVDKKGNWTKRLENIISDRSNYTILHQRTIKYSEEYEIVNYFELIIETAILEGQVITDPEVLNPNPNKSVHYEDKDEAFFDRKKVYQSFRKLMFQKYFNREYFFQFASDKKGTTKVLEDRLPYYQTTFAFDLKNKKYYSGRTKTKRWFDKTRSFNRLESTESSPTPTEKLIQINGYQCREYTKPNQIGSVDRFYVTEEFPFINYGDFTFRLPGFVMKTERYLPILGTVEIIVDIEKCKYPFHFLEFVKGLNEEYGTEVGYLRKKQK